MSSEVGRTDRLVTRAELAALAGVKRPTITTWAKRHEDFPQPVRAADLDYFPLASAIAWLDHRPIAAKERAADEPAEFTYGQRVRRRSLPAADIPPVQSGSFDDGEQVLRQLLGPLAAKVSGGTGYQADYLIFLFCLIFLRGCAAQHWSELRRISGSPKEEIPPRHLLWRIGEITDRTLRQYGILPGLQAAFERLRPHSSADLVEVIRLCDQLSPMSYGPLLDRFATETQLRSTDFFTPNELTLLMASLVVKENKTGASIYDPYLRGGELLRAAASVSTRSNKLRVIGESPNRETLRIAGMNLALHGQPAELRLGSSTPWVNQDHPHPSADAVALNPPFNNRGSITGSRSVDGWPFGPPPLYNDNYAWLQYAIKSLAPNGTAAVLMPDQASVSSDGQEHKIRAEMVEQGAVEAIIGLPSRLFPSTDIAVTLWIVSRPAGLPRQVLFVDARKMSRKTGTGHALAPDAINLISEIYARRRLLAEDTPEKLSDDLLGVSASIDEIRRRNYSLNPSDYVGRAIGIALRAPSGHTATDLHELAALKSRANRADARVDKLKALPRSGFSRDLPSGWTRFPLAELCEIQAGPSYSRLGTEERTENGSVPIVMPRHLRDRRVVAAEAERTTDEVARRLSKFRLSANDILCVRSGAMTEPALVEQQQEGWLFGTNLLRLRLVNCDMTDPRYLVGFLCLPSVQGWIRSRSSEGVVPTISTQSLGELIVNLPLPSEQRHIGSAFLALDEQIAAHLHMAQAATQALTTLAEHLMEGALTI